MKKITKIISVALLAGALSMTAVGCGTTGDQSNVSSSSQSSTQDILSQDPKEVYKKVGEKMQSINSFSTQGEMNAVRAGDSQVVKSTSSMEVEDLYSDNPKAKTVGKINIGDNVVEATMYYLDGYKYISTSVSQNSPAVNLKSPMTEEDKKIFKPQGLSDAELDNLKLEKDSEGRIAIVSGLTQNVKDTVKRVFSDAEMTEGYQRIIIDSDYKITSFEFSAKGESNGEISVTMKNTYSYEPVKIEFPSFDGYVESNF